MLNKHNLLGGKWTCLHLVLNWLILIHAGLLIHWLLHARLHHSWLLDVRLLIHSWLLNTVIMHLVLNWLLYMLLMDWVPIYNFTIFMRLLSVLEHFI